MWIQKKRIDRRKQMNKVVVVLLPILAFVGVVSAQGTELELGGEITVWPKDPGKFLFINAQRQIDPATLAKPIEKLRSDFAINIGCVQGDAPDLRAVPATLKGLDATGAMWIVNDPALPISLVAAENGWGMLNVAPLVADSPAAAILEKRVSKFILRTFANINGVGDSAMMPACVMKPAIGVEGVDNLVCATYSPEACSKIETYLALSGYKRCNMGTYYDACEEGWAPAPTNAVQKAIWDKVHQMPTKPIKIVPESKRPNAK